MDYLDRVPDKDASEDNKENLYLADFTTFLGYYLLRIEIPDYVKNEFYSSSFEPKDPTHYTIYNMLKNAPDLNDFILRQMIIKLL